MYTDNNLQTNGNAKDATDPNSAAYHITSLYTRFFMPMQAFVNIVRRECNIRPTMILRILVDADWEYVKLIQPIQMQIVWLKRCGVPYHRFSSNLWLLL